MPEMNSSTLSASGTSQISASLSAFVNKSGAGIRAAVTATSPTGETVSRTKEEFSVGATASSAQVSVSVFQEEPSLAIATTTAQKKTLIQGTNRNDVLFGGNGNEELQGMDGNDVLFGGGGTDYLTGGEGSDLFVISAETNDPLLADRITDFSSASGDKLRLVGLAADNLILEAFDSTADGNPDATLIKFETSVLGIVLGTVDGTGNTTLTDADFVTSMVIEVPVFMD